MNNITYNFIDSNDFIELNDLFNNLVQYKNDDKLDEYIKKIEQMIEESNGFKNYVLK
jgi:predicted DNA-binding ArsR family transcriptional regulator